MASDMQTRWEIDLSIAGTDRINKNVKELEHNLKSVSDKAREMDYSGAISGVEALEAQMTALRDSEEDCTKEMESFGRVSGKAYKELESQATKLNYSLSEQGKEQRARIEELKREKEALTQSAADRKRAKEIEKEIAAISRDVVDVSDDELKRMIASNREARARLKLLQQEAKVYHYTAPQQRAELKTLKDKMKALVEYTRGLLKNEEAWKRIGSAAEKAGKLAKTTLKIGAGVVGGALAIGGMAMTSAPQQAQKEAEARRVKGGGSLEDKTTLVGDLYIKTGADSSTIVDAINRVYSVLGSNLSREEVIQAATAEVQFPGAAALFRQQNTGTVTARDFQRYTAKMRALQGATGASVEQIRGSADYIANLRQTYFQNATENDLQSVYLALQGSGAFDNEEELQRAFRSFARNYTGNQNIFEAAQSYDWGRTAYGATNKQQARKAIGNLDWNAVKEAQKVEEYRQTAAEKDAERVRKLEETKNRIMAQILKIMEPLASELEKALDSDTVKKIAEGLVSFLTKTVPILSQVMSALASFLQGNFGTAFEGIAKTADRLAGVSEDSFFSYENTKARRDALINGVKGLFGYAGGGITSLPSLCGEAGPEAVIPLSYERSGRGVQLLQQVEQHFNMHGTETTTASLASMVGSNAFAFESGRLSSLSRRRGI